MNSHQSKFLILFGLLAIGNFQNVLAQKQATLGNRSAEILRIGGLQFKDLNKNKKLAKLA